LPQKFIETKNNIRINKYLVAERFVRWWRLIVKLTGGIKSEHTGISSLNNVNKSLSP